MDFGINAFDINTLTHDENNTIIINNNRGSELTEKQRSDSDRHLPDHHHHHFLLQTPKSSKTDYFDHPQKTMPVRSDSLLSLSAPDSNNMLSFSSSSSSTTTTKNGNHPSLFSFCHPSTAYIRHTGYGYGGLTTAMHMYKGPFTPTQWMELEHQALIYKHFVANVPVPSHLLNPLTKSSIFGGSSSLTSYAPNSYGWGTFHLGLSGKTDPEPGRCRRTDGKKWRCSRDAVPDQKYCERHINRGRHRSRKPVEGHNGHAVSETAAAKAGRVVSSLSVPVSSSRVTVTALNGVTLHHRSPTIAASAQTPISRTKEPESFSSYTSFSDHGASNPNPLPHFIDAWSKDESPKQDWTQLSMSIPMAASDFSSSSNSPAQEKLTVPPLGVTPEFHLDPTHDKQPSNWIPISWGNSMGGPLGEVLNRTSSSSGETRPFCYTGSSPTGVLQKTPFVSLSNSSSTSSPKANKKDEYGGSGGLSDELLLSTLAS